MPSARVEVIQTVLPGDEPADQAINTLHFNSGTDWQALATYVMEAFSGQVFGPGGPFSQYVQRKMEVRTYDIADPKPRPVKASATFTPAPWTGDTLGPRLLACCLSFYATRNLPRIRGRIYIGPFVGTVCSHEEIPAATMTNILALGETLHQGVAGWQHITRSNTEANDIGGGGAALAEERVTNYWVDSNWDVMHSREPRTATRDLYP